MRPPGQLGGFGQSFTRLSHPPTTQSITKPIVQYTLSSGLDLQGPMPFWQYREYYPSNIWDFKAEGTRYLKLSLNHFLGQQSTGNIAIGGLTGLSCRLEQQLPSDLLNALRQQNSTLNTILQKRQLELYCTNTATHIHVLKEFCNYSAPQQWSAAAILNSHKQ